MKLIYSILKILMIFSFVILPFGCGSQKNDHRDEKSESGGHEEGESTSGAAFKPGKGIILKEETSRIIGLEIADVIEEMLPQEVQLNAQIFSETHRLADLKIDHTGCQFHGSGFLAVDQAVLIKPKQAVKFKTFEGEVLDGFVVSVQKPLAHGEIEIIVGVTTTESKLEDGQFVNATISVPRDEPVITIPRSALLRTVEGAYVYVVNGDAYYRMAVSVGNGADGKIEITDGLYEGDQVVVKPVETLWIIELRATKGGGHSH